MNYDNELSSEKAAELHRVIMQMTKPCWLLAVGCCCSLHSQSDWTTPHAGCSPPSKKAPRLESERPLEGGLKATHRVSDPIYVHTLYLTYLPCRIRKTNRPDTWLVIFVVNARSDATYVTFLAWTKAILTMARALNRPAAAAAGWATSASTMSTAAYPTGITRGASMRPSVRSKRVYVNRPNCSEVLQV